MNYKTVLAPMIVEETARIVADAALAVAGHAEGHVVGKHIRQLQYYSPAIVDGPGAALSMGSVNEAIEAAAAALAEALHNVFDEACDAAGAHQVPSEEASRKAGLTASWSDSRGIFPASVSRAARVADLAVAALPGKRCSDRELDLVESLLMSSGKPVLLIPHSGLPALPQRILVGWDGSRAAARALDAALPLLRTAEDVRLVTIKHVDTGTPSAGDAANYLRLHDIDTTTDNVDRAKGGVAKQLLSEADSAQSDLLVLGGYSHSRFEEAVLGGVTRYVLDHADRAVLMAH